MTILKKLQRLFMPALALLAIVSCTFVVPEPIPRQALKIGLLLNYTGSPEASADREKAFRLAIRHVNAGGGVLGRPVTGVAADATSDPVAAVAEARRLIEEEGVHAIVGPNASSAALPIAELVAGPAGVPVISPSATSPRLTTARDGDLFFRTALSDAIQGPVLARLTRAQGFDSVGLIHVGDPYGQGLADAFAREWDGSLRVVPVESGQLEVLNEVRESAASGGQALVVIAHEEQALAIVRAALDAGLYDRFVFGDSAKRLRLPREIGGHRLAGMPGTAGAADPENAATPAWEAAYVETYGALPVLAYVKETYDATVALALAAQAAGSLEGLAMRDQLRAVGGPPGERVLGVPADIARGLRWLAEGLDIDYEGAANSLDWDENGDLRQGHVGIWRFTRDADIEEVETIFVKN